MQSARKVKRNLPMPDGGKIVLYAWGSSTELRLRNVERIGPDGSPMWQAELPPSDRPDCFVRLQRNGDAVEVETFNGATFRICLATGAKA